MPPLLTIQKAHLRHNVETVLRLCHQYGIEPTGITKVVAGDAEIAQVMVDAGLKMLGDSRVENLKSLQAVAAEKWLIRPPVLSEVEELCRYADVSLNSELATIEAIQQVSRQLSKPHKIILMVDLGDLREGYTDFDELVQVAERVEQMDSVILYGIGTNLTCFSFVTPDAEKMDMLAQLRERIEKNIGRTLDVVSGGNSATIHLMQEGGIPRGVNNLRLGESILFGKERLNFTFLPDTYQDVFTLSSEICERKVKPSMPWGHIGCDSYGHIPSFTDQGLRTQAICALGKQDFDAETSYPTEEGVQILGASSDHLMLDITHSKHQYQVGDRIPLRLGYFSTMRAFTSRYVAKCYIED